MSISVRKKKRVRRRKKSSHHYQTKRNEVKEKGLGERK